jgi:hypothetical protein
MMSKKTSNRATPDTKKFPRKAVPCDAGKTDDESGRFFAQLATSSELAAYRVINISEANSGLGKHIDVPTLVEVLRKQAAAANRNDLTQAEAMLMNQATALQSLFARLAEKAMSAEYMANFEAFMRMALRAQNQSRATLETLATMKNPPMVYARQANIASGPQQVNNGLPSPARETETATNKLSGNGNELPSDSRASTLTCHANQRVETLGKIDRAEVGRG